jgi:pimeloyl-ACP methyl ester carboxylesterase
MFRCLVLWALALALLAASATDVAAAPTLQLEDCRINAGPGSTSLKARCGTLRRPLDPNGVVAGEIELWIAVVPALNLTPENDPFVPIAGGPGQSSVQFFSSYASAFEGVRRNRDIVLVDQRGTGASARLDCAIDESLVDSQPSTEETIHHTKKCLQDIPHDPRFFSTSVAVTDLEAVRQALGYPAFNLYGISYGTRVAQHFARRYPGATRSVVLDGVVPPDLSLGPEIATESQRAIDRIIERCESDAACNARFPNLQQTFARVLRELQLTPVSIKVPDPSTGQRKTIRIGAAEFAIAIRLLAYHPNSIAMLPLLIQEAGDGNLVPLGAQYSMTLGSLSEQIAVGMHNAIVCTEDVPYYDEAAIDYDGLAASYMGNAQLETLQAICSVWPSGAIDENFKQPLATALPVLLLSGDADPITPPRYAEAAAVKMTNSLHLIGRHQGHGQVAVGCMPQLVAKFVDSADPGQLETECLERSFVMPFFLGFSGPQP